MIRIYTGRNITTMTYKHSLWNRTFEELIRKTMSLYYLLAIVNTPIPAVMRRAQPKPASIGLLNLRPKARNWVSFFASAIVPHDITKGLPTNSAALFISYTSKFGRLTTAALTEFRGIEVEGKLYNVHTSSFSRRVSQTRAVTAAPGFLMPNYII